MTDAYCCEKLCEKGGRGLDIYMCTFFFCGKYISLPFSCADKASRNMTCCGAVCQNHNGMPQDFGCKALQSQGAGHRPLLE